MSQIYATAFEVSEQEMGKDGGIGTGVLMSKTDVGSLPFAHPGP